MNLNHFFAIFDLNNDNDVEKWEVLEFGKRRNMQGMQNLAGILLGSEGIQDLSQVNTALLVADQKRFEKAATTYFYSMFQRFDVTGDLRLNSNEYSKLLNTYADDFLKRHTKEYKKVKSMVNQIKFNSKFNLRFCDFVRKYVEQFMLQGMFIYTTQAQQLMSHYLIIFQPNSDP